MADSTTHVIRYVGDIREVSKSVATLERINKKASQVFGTDFNRSIQVLSKNIDTISRKRVIINGKPAIETILRLNTVTKTTNGQLRTFSERFRLVNGAVKGTSSTLKEGGKSARTFGQNLSTLLKRAALTIPVWFAIRQGIASIFRTIRDGLGDIVEFDRALQKLRRNFSATSDNVEEDFSRVRNEIEAFSRRTGVAVEDITNAIQRFATVGFDVETSLQGGLRATQLAITLFGDADETANAFARSLRVLTEGITNSADRQRAIAEALALTDQLWQTNAFEVNEFSNNLEKFAGTARIANLSIEDTLTLLATLSTGGLGNRAGRLLRTTILRSLADIEKVTRTLNLQFDPDNQPTIVFIQELIGALKELKTEENVPAELSEVLADLFSVRSTEVLGALTALEDTLRQNIALRPDIEAFDRTLEDQLETTSRLVDQFKNLNKEIGRSFVTGLIGGEDFDDSLQKIIKTQDEILKRAEAFGRIIGSTFNVFEGGIVGATISEGLGKNLQDALSASNRVVEESGARFARLINQAFRDQLDLSELNALISDLEVFGAVQIGFDEATFDRTLEALIRIRDTQREINEETKKQIDILKQNAISQRDSQRINQLILQGELERLKAQGATSAEILKATNLLTDQLNIKEDQFDVLQRQLQLEQSISEEQRLRNRLSSDSVKLFRIAQEEGVGIARAIGEVLAGQRDFNTFVRRGGDALEVFKRDFGEIFEAQQAERFFQGLRVPGLEGLRGGFNIPIEEEALRTTPGQLRSRAEIQRARAESALPRIQADIRSRISIDVTGLSLQEAVNTLKKDITNEVNNPQSDFSRSLKRQILGTENTDF